MVGVVAPWEAAAPLEDHLEAAAPFLEPAPLEAPLERALFLEGAPLDEQGQASQQEVGSLGHHGHPGC